MVGQKRTLASATMAATKKQILELVTSHQSALPITGVDSSLFFAIVP